MPKTVGRPTLGFGLLLMATALIFSACLAAGQRQPPAARIEQAHPSGSVNVAFSPGTRYLASSGFFGEIKIWSLPELQPVTTFANHRQTPRALVWLDDEVVVSGDRAGRIYAWRAHDGAILYSLQTSSGIADMGLLPDKKTGKKMIVSGHVDGTLRTFDSAGLQPVAHYRLAARVLSLAVDPNRDRLAVLFADRNVFVFDATLAAPAALAAPPATVYEIAFSPDGSRLAAGGWFNLYFWDIAANRLETVKSDHWGAAHSLAFFPDGSHLATIGRHTDSQILLIDAATGVTQRRLLRHELCGTVVRISPDGRYLASGSDDASIRLYDLSDW